MSEQWKTLFVSLLPGEILKIWEEMTAAIDALYDVDRLWGKGFGQWQAEYKYRRGGKTLCTFYAKEGAAVLLITYGRAEREKFENIRADLSPALITIYNETVVLHDGKWLWLPLDEKLQLQDVMAMLRIKRKPNRKKEDQ